MNWNGFLLDTFEQPFLVENKKQEANAYVCLEDDDDGVILRIHARPNVNAELDEKGETRYFKLVEVKPVTTKRWEEV